MSSRQQIPGRRIVGTIVVTFALFGVASLGVALSGPAFGGADAPFVAARGGAIAGAAALAQAGAKEGAPTTFERRDRAGLKNKLATLLGPLSFKGLGKNPDLLPADTVESPGGPDGLQFHDAAYKTRIFVTPEAVFVHWLAAEAGTSGATHKTEHGIADAIADDSLYTSAIDNGAAYTGYMRLPLAEQPGQTVYASLGLFAQDDTFNYPPNAVVVARVADGRVALGSTAAPEASVIIPACSKVWESYEAKSRAARATTPAGKGDDEPNGDEADRLTQEGMAAFRACYAAEIVKLPVYAAILKKTEALREKMSGK